MVKTILKSEQAFYDFAQNRYMTLTQPIYLISIPALKVSQIEIGWLSCFRGTKLWSPETCSTKIYAIHKMSR